MCETINTNQQHIGLQTLHHTYHDGFFFLCNNKNSCFPVFAFLGGSRDQEGGGGGGGSEQQQGRGGFDLLWSYEPNLQGVSPDPNSRPFCVQRPKMKTIKDP